MQDISELSKSEKEEIAAYIKRNNLEIVNETVKPVHIRQSFYTKCGKRILDIIFSFVGLIVTLPVNLVVAIITYFDVGRPILFKQIRIGKNGQPFTLCKFRNMTNEADVNGELLPPTQRITKWGHFVRKTSLDELLNFVSVLNGSMSIIGPRPLPDYYVDRLNDKHKMIFSIKPGLECPSLHKENDCSLWQQRLDNYVWYAENCSLLLDIRLLFRMVQMVFDRKNTEVRANADHGGLLGYDLTGNIICTTSVPDNFVEEFCLNHGYADLNEAIIARKYEKSFLFESKIEKEGKIKAVS